MKNEIADMLADNNTLLVPGDQNFAHKETTMDFNETDFDFASLLTAPVKEITVIETRTPRQSVVTGLRIDVSGKTTFASVFGAEPSHFLGSFDTVAAAPARNHDDTASVLPVVETSLGHTFGTIFSPAQFLHVAGHVIAGPVFHGQVSLKNLFEGDAYRGMHWVLEPYAVQVMLLAMGRVGIDSVQSAAAAAFGIYLERVAISRRSGMSIDSKIVIDNRLADGVIGISVMELEVALPHMNKQFRTEITLDNVSGIQMVFKREPATDLDCIQTVKAVAMDCSERGIRMNDVTAKKAGADGDGDPITVGFLQSYTKRQLLADLGTMQHMELAPDAKNFGTLTWDVQDAKTYVFQSGKQLATGLAVKSLFQGLISNYFARIAGVGVALCNQDASFVESMRTMLNKKGHTLNSGDTKNIVRTLMNSLKTGETVMTEVIQDFRKYVMGTEEANEKQFSKELFAIAAAAGRKSISGSLPSTLKNISKGGKKINMEGMQAVVGYLKTQRPADFLAGLSLQNCVVGGAVLASQEARFALADTFSEMGADKSLLALAGLCCEEEKQVATKDSRINKEEPTFGGSWPSLNTNDPWSYILATLDARGIKGVRTSGGSRVVKFAMPNGTHLTFNWDLAVQQRPIDGLVSFIEVTIGQSKRYARQTIRPAVRNLAQVEASRTPVSLICEYGVEVVSLLDQIVEMIEGLVLDMKTAKADPNKPFNWVAWEKEALARKQELLDSNTRLPGQSNKGDEIVHGRMETHTMQTSIELPKTADATENYHALCAMAELIDGNSFQDVLCAGHTFRPFVGATSKSSPMTVCFLVKENQQLPSHVYAVNQFIANTDRILRESGTPLQAKRLRSPKVIITNGTKIGKLAERRFDGVWAVISGVASGLCSDGAHNADQGYLTPKGLANFETAPMRLVKNGLTEEQVVELAVEYGYETRADLEMNDWTVTTVLTPLPGKAMRAATRLSTQSFNVISPLDATPQTLYKIWLSGGDKFLAPSLRKDYYVVIDGVKVSVDGMVSQETMVGFQDGEKWDGGKKQDLTVLAGLLSLLGKHDWKGEEHLELDSLQADVELSLAAHNLPITGRIPMYNEDGEVVGECIPMLLPGYVCYEDDRASKVTANGFKRSLNVTRLLGETITLSNYDKAVLTGLADTAAGKGPKGPLCPVTFCMPDDEYSADYNWNGYENLPILDRVSPEMDRAMYPHAFGSS